MGSIYIQVTQCLSGYGCDDHKSLEALRDDCNYYEERPASPSDLVAVLQSEGVGEVVETLKNPYNYRVPVSAPGRYLVVRIEDGET